VTLESGALFDPRKHAALQSPIEKVAFVRAVNDAWGLVALITLAALFPCGGRIGCLTLRGVGCTSDAPRSGVQRRSDVGAGNTCKACCVPHRAWSQAGERRSTDLAARSHQDPRKHGCPANLASYVACKIGLEVPRGFAREVIIRRHLRRMERDCYAVSRERWNDGRLVTKPPCSVATTLHKAIRNRRDRQRTAPACLAAGKQLMEPNEIRTQVRKKRLPAPPELCKSTAPDD
jgi:hypothetical protein